MLEKFSRPFFTNFAVEKTAKSSKGKTIAERPDSRKVPKAPLFTWGVGFWTKMNSWNKCQSEKLCAISAFINVLKTSLHYCIVCLNHGIVYVNKISLEISLKWHRCWVSSVAGHRNTSHALAIKNFQFIRKEVAKLPSLISVCKTVTGIFGALICIWFSEHRKFLRNLIARKNCYTSWEIPERSREAFMTEVWFMLWTSQCASHSGITYPCEYEPVHFG